MTIDTFCSQKLPLQLKWRRGPDMPFKMSDYAQSVQIQGTLYVGGGDAGIFNENNYVVTTYDIRAGKWATLPPHRAHSFAMTVISNHLVLVGGMGRGGYSKVLGVWRADSKKWTHLYPDMTTPRGSCSTVTYKQWVVVAGGYGAGGRLSSVEVMNTDTKQWYAGPPTPIAWSSMKTAVVDDMCYLMGGCIGDGGANNVKVYSVSFSALVSQLNPDSSAKDTQIWKEIPQLPVKYAAPLSISGSLLAVGGTDKYDKAVSAIHLYQPDAGQWVKVSDMPAERYDCTCTMTTDQELLVAGGYAMDRLARVDIAHNITC